MISPKALVAIAIFTISIRPLSVSGDDKVFKRNRLVITAFWPVTGDAMFDGVTCKAAMDIAVSKVNTKSDILRNYEISVVMVDEGENGLLARGKLLEIFLEDADRIGRQRNTTLAPVVILPYYSIGCKGAGAMLHHLNLVGISTSCTTPEITANRYMYPNLYRIRTPTELTLQTKLKYMMNYGGWSRIGIIANAASSRDYMMSTLMYHQALQQGFTVATFEAVHGHMEDSVAESLRKSDARIIFMDTGSIGFVLEVLCSTYRFGISGSKYVFVVEAAGAVDDIPEVISPNCFRSFVMAQFEITIWIGMITEGDTNYGKTFLGYDLDEFDDIFDVRTGTRRTGEHNLRHLCNDAMTLALISLDKAENKLNKENLTLADVVSQPEKIMQAVNQSASEANFLTLHAGPLKYSQRLEFDDEPQIIMSMPDGITLFGISRPSNSSPFNLSNYIFRKITEHNWTTLDGSPPRDHSLIITECDNDDHFFPLLVLAICAILLTICQSLGIVKSLFMQKENPLLVLSVMKKFRILVFLGCLLLNFASATFFWQQLETKNPHAVCLIQSFCILFGVSFVNCAFLLRICVSYFGPTGPFRSLRENLLLGTPRSAPNWNTANRRDRRTSSIVPSSRRGSLASQGAKIEIKPEQIKLADLFILSGTLVVSIINAIIFATWHIEMNAVHGSFKEILRWIDAEQFYDSRTDIYYDQQVAICVYHFDTNSFVAIIAVQCLCLLWSAVLDARSQKDYVFCNNDELKRARLAVVNFISLFCVAILILVIWPYEKDRITITAVFTLAMSATMFGILFLPPPDECCCRKPQNIGRPPTIVVPTGQRRPL